MMVNGKRVHICPSVMNDIYIYIHITAKGKGQLKIIDSKVWCGGDCWDSVPCMYILPTAITYRIHVWYIYLHLVDFVW